MRRVIGRRGPADQHSGRLLRAAPADHPVVLGAGVAGLLAVSALRRRTRDPRDEPWTLGIGF